MERVSIRLMSHTRKSPSAADILVASRYGLGRRLNGWMSLSARRAWKLGLLVLGDAINVDIPLPDRLASSEFEFALNSQNFLEGEFTTEDEWR